MHYKEKKKKLETVKWGSEPLMWGSVVSFAKNGARKSEMWGSPSLPQSVRAVESDSSGMVRKRYRNAWLGAPVLLFWSYFYQRL